MIAGLGRRSGPILLKKAPGRSSGPKMSNILARRWPGMGNYSAESRHQQLVANPRRD
jgi:hypothetical protein